MSEKPKCEAQVSPNTRWPRFTQCSRIATIREDGKVWCKQHAPSAKKARDEARYKKMRDEWGETEARSKAAALRDRKAAEGDNILADSHYL